MPAPALGPLATRVAATRPELRGLLKAGLIVAALKQYQWNWSVNGVDFTLTKTPKVNKAGQLEVWIDAVGANVDNPYLFVNPPLLVPGVGTWTDDDGNEIPNYREDAAEAAMVAIAQAVGVL